MYFSTGVGNIKEFFNTKRALQFAQLHRSCAVPTDATPQPKATLYDVDAVYIYQCIPIFILWNYACQRWSRTLIGLKLYTWCMRDIIYINYMRAWHLRSKMRKQRACSWLLYKANKSCLHWSICSSCSRTWYRNWTFMLNCQCKHCYQMTPLFCQSVIFLTKSN
jgi:hypothetical protein